MGCRVQPRSLEISSKLTAVEGGDRVDSDHSASTGDSQYRHLKNWRRISQAWPCSRVCSSTAPVMQCASRFCSSIGRGANARTRSCIELARCFVQNSIWFGQNVQAQPVYRLRHHKKAAFYFSIIAMKQEGPMAFISELIGRPVTDQDGKLVGTLKDLVARKTEFVHPVHPGNCGETPRRGMDPAILLRGSAVLACHRAQMQRTRYAPLPARR